MLKIIEKAKICVLRLGYLPIFSLLFLCGIKPLYAEKNINLDIKFFVVSNITIYKKNIKMQSWIEEDHARSLVQCINNIFYAGFKEGAIAGGLNFVLKSFNSIQISDTKLQNELLKYIRYFSRAPVGSFKQNKKMRRKAFISIFGKELIRQNDLTNDIHVYILPFIGDKYQGSATFSRKWPYKKDIFLSDWTNRNSDNGKPRKRNLLPEVMTNSMCKTLGHEMGHVLNLEHHKGKKNRKYLMVGSWGTRLKASEAQTAWNSAKKLNE